MSKVSRRRFLGNLSTGTALAMSAPLMSSFSVPPFLRNNEDKKLGVALIGLGYYATNQLAPALQKTSKCYLAGIVTGTPSKAETWKAKYNIPEKNIYNYENFDSIAENPDIPIVYVVLPNSMHHEFTIRAAKAGKHVICEKPMAISSKQCQEMIDACKKAGVKLSIGYRLHFEPYNMEAARIGQNKEFGAVKTIENSFGFKAGDPNQWRLKKEMAGGGPMMDVGIYAINAARYITGEEPLAVTAQEYKTDPVKFKDVEETVFWQMEFPGKAYSSHVTTYAANTERLFFAAEEGWFELRPAYGYGPLAGKTSRSPLDLPIVTHQVGQMDDFAGCVMENRVSSVSGEEGLKDLKIIEAIYKSMTIRQRVTL